MFKNPIQMPFGSKFRLTNKFGPVEDKYKDFYKQNYNINFHAGIDCRVEGPHYKSYGTPIINLFDGVVVYSAFHKVFGTDPNGVMVESHDGMWRARYWHLSRVDMKYMQNVKEGQIVGLMGNTGIVYPTPTYANPYNGVHLHLTLERKRPNDMTDEEWDALDQQVKSGNWMRVDPLEYVDINNITYGPDTGAEADVPPLMWTVQNLITQVKALIALRQR